MKKFDLKSMQGSKRTLRSGSYAAVLAMVVLAVVILINLVVQALPSKWTEFDISTSSLFTLSDTSKNLLHELNSDVTAYYLAESGQEDTNITRLLDRYADESSHFSWQQRDPVLYPTFAQQYDGAANGSVVLVCGDNYRVVGYNDMYQMDIETYYTTGSQQYTFEAENALTSALAQASRTSAYKLYQLTGHGELALDSDFTEMTSQAARDTIVVADRFPFRYLAEDYGLTYYAAFPGCSAETEASFETIVFLSEKVESLHLPCVLVTEGSNSSLAKTILENAGSDGKILTLQSLQAVSQKEIDTGVTYLSKMQENYDVLKQALNS